MGLQAVSDRLTCSYPSDTLLSACHKLLCGLSFPACGLVEYLFWVYHNLSEIVLKATYIMECNPHEDHKIYGVTVARSVE